MLGVKSHIGRCLLTIIFASILHSNSYASASNDSFFVYAKEQLSVIQKIKNTDISQAIDLTQKLLTESYPIKNDSVTNFIKYRLAFYHMMLNNQDESLALIEEILEYYKSNNFKRYGVLLTRKATIHKRKGNYDTAIEYLQMAEPICKDYDMTINLGMINLYYSDIHIYRGDFVNAYKYADIALGYFKNENRIDFESAALTSLGYISLKLKEYNSAQDYFDQIFVDSSKITNKSFLIRPIFYNGMLAFEQDNLEKAKSEFEIGLKHIDKLGNFPDLSTIYIYTARIAIKEGRFKEAKDYLDLAYEASSEGSKRDEWLSEVLRFKLYKISGLGLADSLAVRNAYSWAREHGDYDLLKETSNLMAECLIEMGRTEEAFEFKSVYAEAAANKLESENLNKIALLRARNKLEQDARLKDLEADQLELKIASNKKVTLMFMISSIILFLMSGLLFYYFRLQNAANSKLKVQNAALTTAEEKLAFKNKELEKYIESNIQLSQFAHIASHDLKSPLRTIGSFTGLLRKKFEKDVDHSSMAYINFIENAAGELSNLVNDLLQFSKVNSLKLKIEECNVEKLIKDVIKINQQVIEEAGVVIELADLPQYILADSGQLKQVFQNLITNAIKFRSINKTPIVTISCKDHDRFWEFSVEDNGIGIDVSYHNKIFEDFSRLHTKNEYEGTGLGLSISKKIIEKHSGKIWVESTVGKGSSFKFRLPKEENMAA